jgi:Protein of unknown function (DUF2846)
MQGLFALMMFLAPLAFAQSQTASPTAAGCGPAEVKFKVLIDQQNHSAGQPESGKALVYLIQDDTQFLSRPRPTTRVGIDGTWVGATQSKSYFYVSVEPGEHRVCASWQSFVGADVAHSTAAVHLTAVAAHTYYFVVRNSYQSQPRNPANIELVSVDDAQGQLLASESAFSTSRHK